MPIHPQPFAALPQQSPKEEKRRCPMTRAAQMLLFQSSHWSRLQGPYIRDVAGGAGRDGTGQVGAEGMNE
jgi:hypothetical protein